MIKTYRGKLEDGGQHRIRLSTNNGLTGYKILKFQIMMEQPGNTAQESLVQIFTKGLFDVNGDPDVPTSAGTVDFSNPLLIAAAYQDTNVHPTEVVIVDNIIINQDLFVTYTDNGSGTNEDINYYIELEQMKLSKDEATMATLKDMRAGPSSFAP